MFYLINFIVHLNTVCAYIYKLIVNRWWLGMTDASLNGSVVQKQGWGEVQHFVKHNWINDITTRTPERLVKPFSVTQFVCNWLQSVFIYFSNSVPTFLESELYNK